MLGASVIYFVWQILAVPQCDASAVVRFKIGSRIYAPWVSTMPAAFQPKKDPPPRYFARLRGLEYCEASLAEPTDAAGFGFFMPPSDRFEGSHVATSVWLTSSISPSWRATASAPSSADIRSISYSAPIVSEDRKWATFVMTILTNAHGATSVEARCHWAEPFPPPAAGRPYACRSVLRLEGGNTLQVITSPRDGELAIIGEGLLAALRIIETFDRGRDER